MVANVDAPARGSAAATASFRRHPPTSGGAAAGGGGGASTMLQFYTDEIDGHKMSTDALLIMGIRFIVVVVVLHIFGKLYRTPN